MGGKAIPVAMVAAAAFAMVFLSDYLGHPDIMLPSLGAFMTGAWLVDTNLWHYSKRVLFLAMPLAATIGLCLSILFASRDALLIYPAVFVAFLLTAGVQIFGRTQIYPCFGAAILPILLQTTSWVYPLSVLCMAGILCAGRAILERTRIRQPLKASEFSDFPEHRRHRLLYYFELSLGLIPALAFVPFVGDHFLLIAPMFVTYATFCNHHSTFVRHPVQTWAQLSLAMAVGSGLSFAVLYLGSSLSGTAFSAVFAVAAACAVLLTIGNSRVFFHRIFPPAMSVALTPFLIRENPWLLLYVPCMMAYFIFAAWVIRSHPAYSSRDLEYM